jgi:hypothetical protein
LDLFGWHIESVKPYLVVAVISVQMFVGMKRIGLGEFGSAVVRIILLRKFCPVSPNASEIDLHVAVDLLFAPSINSRETNGTAITRSKDSGCFAKYA